MCDDLMAIWGLGQATAPMCDVLGMLAGGGQPGQRRRRAWGPPANPRFFAPTVPPSLAVVRSWVFPCADRCAWFVRGMVVGSWDSICVIGVVIGVGIGIGIGFVGGEIGDLLVRVVVSGLVVVVREKRAVWVARLTYWVDNGNYDDVYPIKT